MKGINRVIIVGTLGQDPDVRYTSSGSAVASISLATNEKWTDKSTGEVKERTEWHRVKFFGRLAEVVGDYLRKGGKLYVEGSIRTEKYTDKEGVERYSTDIIASEMQMLGDASSGGGRIGSGKPSTSAPARTGPQRSAPKPPVLDDFDDDIPFN